LKSILAPLSVSWCSMHGIRATYWQPVVYIIHLKRFSMWPTSRFRL